ncbi:MAG TPA: ABC transporter ATP-binding protein [Acidimicrobiales bacterium]|jgi:ABC-2 type transport system ATP-binding protein|nr:ABC transporter ATP-binding protein [Acidimicrobiales bacterium]
MQPTAPGPVLRAADLTMTYSDGTTALAGLTVEVPPGSVGLVGANGAGKTTLFRLMLGLVPPTAGWLQVAGCDVVSDPIGARSRVGYMPEHDCLPLDQSAADIVATFGELAGLPPRAARQRASDMLDLVGLDEARFRPVGSFSTGMRQRTKLAQALVADPQLVLLDEPTAGLDPVGREEMLELVARLRGFGISVLMATHLLDDVQQVCEHVVMIERGRLVLAGPIDQLLQTTGTMRVEVGDRDGAAAALCDALTTRGLPARATDDRTVEVDTSGHGEDAFDVVRDAVADLGLRLYSLSTRHRSLDEVFLQRAAR